MHQLLLCSSFFIKERRKKERKKKLGVPLFIASARVLHAPSTPQAILNPPPPSSLSRLEAMSFCPSSHVHASPSTPPSNPKEEPCAEITVAYHLHGPELTQPVPIDYAARAQWLRAAVLGANDGLVSVASLMIGVGAVNQTAKAMLVSGLAGLVAGACSMAIGEFVSVYTQYDIEVAQMKRKNLESGSEAGKEKESLPNPLTAAGASALAFGVGAVLPLLAGGFIRSWGVRVGVVCAVSSLGLAGLGAAGAVLGGANVSKSVLRVLLGGWLAMLVTYGVLRLFGFAFKLQVSSA